VGGEGLVSVLYVRFFSNNWQLCAMSILQLQWHMHSYEKEEKQQCRGELYTFSTQSATLPIRLPSAPACVTVPGRSRRRWIRHL